MKILDLFCGAGGASMGYHRAFPHATILGVDIQPQPDYPFEMWETGWEHAPLDERWDIIHASPPCQSYSSMSNRHGSQELELIADVRERLITADTEAWVIENVVGASRSMLPTLNLCGGMFGLNLQRHRLFETSHLVFQPPHVEHTGLETPVYGKPDGRRLATRTDGTEMRAWGSVAEGQKALGIDWTDDWHQLREAIPPAYTHYIGPFMKAWEYV